ncbi:hypothetical protein KM043_001523 [Ampulex compressa]|nr:hypothetical protein KM043_001523 [Ampulex compressa]
MSANEDSCGDKEIAPTDEASSEAELVQIVPGYASFDDYAQEAFGAMRAGIKAANALPSGENHDYYACFPSFNRAKDAEMKRLLKCMQTIISLAGIPSSIRKRDVEERFELLLDANDILLDRANTCMDKESGVDKNPEVELIVSQANTRIVNGSWNSDCRRSAEDSDGSQAVRLLAAKNVQRPQLTFKDKIDNSTKPWQPRIKDKPNSLKPLALYLEETEKGEAFNHPYEFELDKFTPGEAFLRKEVPRKYKSLDESALIMIEKSSDLDILLDDLKGYNEIAVDLEHHSYRTFQGITCLMQISTPDTDYLIDTLTLRSELHRLNEIFTKPSVLKVFHGADLDVQWLQRDLSLYIVNMFDTHQAAKQLKLPYLSLAYLMKRYCDIDPNKHFQLADWRIRPLPEELVKYAREDTHYLLYIKDILRNALIEQANGQTNILKAVYDRSTEICKQTYTKPEWTDESYTNMYRKSHKLFNNKQLYALKELHKWRDITAREEDDSTGYVLPNHMLLNIAETLPREMQGILACCNPIPPLVRQNLLKLHKIILKAREQPLVKPVLEDDLRQRLTQRTQMTNSEAWMYAPHDIPNHMEARADLPCLLDNSDPPETFPSCNTIEHAVTVFDSPAISEDEDAAKARGASEIRRKKFIFVSPFERYKRVIPMVAEQEAQEREQRQRFEEEARLKRLEGKEKEEKEEEEEEEDDAIARSKGRVYEHFKAVSRSASGQADSQASESPSRKKAEQVALREMHGRKRKRDASIEGRVERTQGEGFGGEPRLHSAVPYGAQEGSSGRIGGEKVGMSKAPQQIRQRAKGEKKSNRKDLERKGMLPSDKFDYRLVDFSSFQGGSKAADSTNLGQFVQKAGKKQDRVRKRKKQRKQKLNI